MNFVLYDWIDVTRLLWIAIELHTRRVQLGMGRMWTRICGGMSLPLGIYYHGFPAPSLFLAARSSWVELGIVSQWWFCGREGICVWYRGDKGYRILKYSHRVCRTLESEDLLPCRGKSPGSNRRFPRALSSTSFHYPWVMTHRSLILGDYDDC